MSNVFLGGKLNIPSILGHKSVDVGTCCLACMLVYLAQELAEVFLSYNLSHTLMAYNLVEDCSLYVGNIVAVRQHDNNLTGCGVIPTFRRAFLVLNIFVAVGNLIDIVDKAHRRMKTCSHLCTMPTHNFFIVIQTFCVRKRWILKRFHYLCNIFKVQADSFSLCGIHSQTVNQFLNLCFLAYLYCFAVLYPLYPFVTLLGE